MRSQPSLPLKTGTDNHVPYLDGTRGMAILIVAITHFFCEFYFFRIGWIGLNLFFILSGYLITRCLFQYQAYSVSGYFRNFYARRILRIFPLYYGVLIFFFLSLPLVSQKLSYYYAELVHNQGYYWLYASNWEMRMHGIPRQTIFFHFWSLAVEEQFYLIWPVLFLVCRTSKSKYILIASVLGLSVVSRIATVHSFGAYMSSLTAAEPLLLGCLLCVLQQDGILEKLVKGLNVAAGIAIGCLVFIFFQNADLGISNELLTKYGYSLIDIILLAIFSSALTGQLWGNAVRKFLSMKWLRWLGKYSYAIYVFHWIIFQTVVFKMQSAMTGYLPGALAYLLPRLAAIVLTVVLSYFSYHYFEKHFLALKKYFTGDVSSHWHITWNYIFPKRTRPARH